MTRFDSKTPEDILVAAGRHWCAQHAPTAPLSRLGRTAIGDGKFFDSLPGMRHGVTTGTLTRFAKFLIDPANWPGGEADIPQEAIELAHRCGVALPGALASSAIDGTDCSDGAAKLVA